MITIFVSHSKSTYYQQTALWRTGISSFPSACMEYANQSD